MQKRNVTCSTTNANDCDEKLLLPVEQACHNHGNCGPMCEAHFHGEDSFSGWEATFQDGDFFKIIFFNFNFVAKTKFFD